MNRKILKLISILALAASGIAPCFAASGTYSTDAGGNWSTLAWTIIGSPEDAQLYPNGIDQVATIAPTVNARTLTINVVGGVTIGKFSALGTFTAPRVISGTEFLTLETTAPATPLIESSNGLTIKAPLKGTQGFTLALAANNFVLEGDNSNLTGDITLGTAGTVFVNHDNALGPHNSLGKIILTGTTGFQLGSTGIHTTVTGRTLIMQGNNSIRSATCTSANDFATATWTGDIVFNRSTYVASNNFDVPNSVFNKVSLFSINGVISSVYNKGTEEVPDWVTDSYAIRFGNSNEYDMPIYRLWGGTANLGNTYAGATEITQGGSGVTKFLGGSAYAMGTDKPFSGGTVTLVNGAFNVSFFSTDNTTRTLENNFFWTNTNVSNSGKAIRTLAFGTLANGYNVSLDMPVSYTAPAGSLGNGNIVLNGNFTVVNNTSVAANDTEVRLLVGPESGSSDFTLTINGILAHTAHATSGVFAKIIKDGGGTLVLTNAANTYAKGIEVKAGKLLITGGKHAGSVSVLANATLGGSGGTIAGAVSLAPNSDFTFNSSGMTVLQSSLTLGTDWTLTLETSATWQLDTWTQVFSYGSLIGSEIAPFIIDNTGLTVDSWETKFEGSALWVQAVTIPEPATLALLGVSLLVVTVLRRKKIS